MTSSAEARFERLLAAHGPALRRLALVYAGNAADADDLMQDIWLAIWQALPRFRGECSERTFIYRIGHNRGLTFRARRRPPGQDVTAAERVADPRDAPDVATERASTWQALLDAVRALPPGIRQVVMLHLEGLGNQEIAQVTGLSENNVAVRLSRARARLRVLLGAPEVVG